MSLATDQKYAGMISAYVRNFTRKHSTYVFSCPVCGDSQTNRSKARGNLYKSGDRLKYNCFNCNTPITSMYGFLKEIDNNLAEQYRVDSFLEDKQEKWQPVVRQSSFADKIDPTLIKVSQLPPNHMCRKYVRDRKIPPDKDYLLYYTDDFIKFAARIDPKIDIPLEYKRDPRLVIPLVTEHQQIAGYQGRSFDPASHAKYLTVLYGEFNGKIFGLDRVDFNKKIYAFEGPLDALFIDNAIAVTGGRIDSVLEHQSLNRNNTITVYDNEPRKPETVAKMKKAIDNGFPVAFWPSSIVQTDVNDMIKAGYTAKDIKKAIDNNVYSGLEAELQLEMWRKV